MHTDDVERDEIVAGVRRLFDLVADSYDAVGVTLFEPIATGLVEAVGAGPGDRAVDLGCGNGVSSRALAAAVGPTGSVVGLDLSPAMVERAAAALDGSPTEVTFVVGDAQDPDLSPASFDAAIASLVVFFLPDAAGAVSRWLRLLRPGGRLGISTFGPSSPQWQALEAPLREFMPPTDPRMAGPQSPFGSDGGMEALVTGAGAVDVQTSSRRVEFAFDDVDHWVRFSRSVGQRIAWERMTDDQRAGVLERSRATFAEVAGPDGSLPVWQQVRYTVGRAPGDPSRS